MGQMKGLVTGGGGLYGVSYVVLWHAVIKSSPGLTARHLFTEALISLTVLSLYPSLHLPPLALGLALRLNFSPSVTFVSPCSLALALSPSRPCHSES